MFRLSLENFLCLPTVDPLSWTLRDAAATGYDTAVAIPAGGAGDEDALGKENNKSIKPLAGKAQLSIAKYDPATGEVAGVFQSVQPSDTDLGAKVPKDIKVQGLWYAQLQQ